MKFTYRSGQRPLDGYTIKRGVGQGGFGEVYFAVSDGGKEVALKLLRGKADTELRGTAACLNLKHPNLVHVYDLRTDSRGDTWLVMEYVLGDSLSKLLHRNPNGLPQAMTRDWFVTLCRAVGYLHDNGVLHRDIKPGNIFMENGTIKVGDYGLCKPLGSASERHSAWVGTSHYMAPEVGKGQYGRSIDVYACGVVLYEMLTGRPPFDGESEHEIMMRHATDAPDLTPVPAPFREVLAKALAKNPNDRYPGVAEMARAVEAVPLAGDSVNMKPKVELKGTNALPIAKPVVQVPPTVVDKELQVKAAAAPMATGAKIVAFKRNVQDTAGAWAKTPFLTAIAILPWLIFSPSVAWADVGKVFLVGVATSWAVLLATFGSKYKVADEWSKRLRLAFAGVGVGLVAFWLDGQIMPEVNPSTEETVKAESFLFGAVKMTPGTLPILCGYVLYFASTLGLVRWWHSTAPDRKEYFSLWPMVVALIFGSALQFLWPSNAGERAMVYGVVPLVMAAAVVQFVSPWRYVETKAFARKQRLQTV